MRTLLNWRIWPGILISLICLWLALRTVPFSDLGGLLAKANYLWLLPAIIAQCFAVVTRAQRWVVLLGGKVPLIVSIWAECIGYLFTNVLPLRMGEPARVVVMSGRSGIPVVQVAATALLERLLDVATIISMLILVLPWMSVPTLVTQAGLLFGSMVVVGFMVLFLAVRNAERSERLLKRILSRLRIPHADALVARWQELVDGLRVMADWGVAIQIIGWSAATWVCSTSVWWCVMQMFQPAASPLEAAFVVVAASLAVAVPSSPGFIGVFQLVGQQALVIPFGDKYTPTNALGITLVAHLVYYLLTTLLGIIGLWQFGESFARLGRALRANQSTAS